jgi:hypothetical protein
MQLESADSTPIDWIDRIDVRESIPPQLVNLKQIDVRESIPPQLVNSKQIDVPVSIEDRVSPPPELNRSDRQVQSIRISARELHKYPLMLVGIFSMFLITYPIAMSRVSQMAKFASYGAHIKSLTPEYRESEPK